MAANPATPAQAINEGECGAGNGWALEQLIYMHCTLPEGHEQPVIDPRTGYPYQHGRPETGDYWTESRGPIR